MRCEFSLPTIRPHPEEPFRLTLRRAFRPVSKGRAKGRLEGSRPLAHTSVYHAIFLCRISLGRANRFVHPVRRGGVDIAKLYRSTLDRRRRSSEHHALHCEQSCRRNTQRRIAPLLCKNVEPTDGPADLTVCICRIVRFGVTSVNQGRSDPIVACPINEKRPR
jgi:hypothetical protein